MRNRGAMLKLKTMYGDVLSPESGLPSSEFPIEYRHDGFGRAGISHPGEACHRSQPSGGVFVELSRTPAMRIVTAVTRPTIVASLG